MAFRTILTITGPHMGDDDLKLAADLCDEIGAHLAVLAVVMAAPPPVGEYAAIVSEDWLKERQADEKLLKKRAFAVSAFLANSALDAAAYLVRHGVKVTVDRLPSENHSVADVLRQHSVDSSAELMVMGTYGHFPVARADFRRRHQVDGRGSIDACLDGAMKHSQRAATLNSALFRFAT